MTSHRHCLTVVVLNHEHWECVVSQLQAYREQESRLLAQVRWIVVHNGSKPIPPLELGDWPGSRMEVDVLLCENRGYGAGVNEALKQVQSPYVLVLNSDLFPEPGFLAHIHHYISQSPQDDRTAVVGFRLLNADGGKQGSAGRFPTLLRMVCGLFLPRSRRKYLSLPDDRPAEADWVTGACMLLKTQFLDEVGGFDEDYFMYYEDVDLCLRARQAGWRVVHDPGASIRHLFPYHSRILTYRMVFLARHGMLTYFQKHRPRWEFELLRWIALAECLVRERSAGWSKVRRMIHRFGKAPLDSRLRAEDLPQ